MYQVAVHRVATSQCALLPLHLVVHIVWVVLTHITLPTRSTSGRTSHCIRDTVFLAHWSALLQSVVCNHVVTKHIHVLLNHGSQVLHQCLHVLYKVRIDVVLQSTYSIIVLDQTSTSGLLHTVQHMLTVAHAIQEGSQGTQVLSHTRGVQQVRIQTLQLVHDGTDILDTVGELHAHGLFNHTYQCMTVLHGTQIVQTVGQCQCLRISHSLPHLLDTTMDITKVWIDALHGLTVEYSLQAQHTMGSRVLRTDVNHIVVGLKQFVLLALQLTLLVQIVLQTVVRLYIILQGVLIVKLPVLTEGMSLKVGTQEQAAHIMMPQEHDAEEIVHLALQQLSHSPDIRNGRDIRRIVLCLCNLLHSATLVGVGILQDIHTAQSLFTEVLTYNGHKIVETFLALQVQHLRGELLKIE